MDDMDAIGLLFGISFLLNVVFQLALLSALSISITAFLAWLIQNLFNQSFKSFFLLIITLPVNAFLLLYFRSNIQACSGFFIYACDANLIYAIIIASLLELVAWRIFLSAGLLVNKDKTKIISPLVPRKKKRK